MEVGNEKRNKQYLSQNGTSKRLGRFPVSMFRNTSEQVQKTFLNTDLPLLFKNLIIEVNKKNCPEKIHNESVAD